MPNSLWAVRGEHHAGRAGDGGSTINPPASHERHLADSRRAHGERNRAQERRLDHGNKKPKKHPHAQLLVGLARRRHVALREGVSQRVSELRLCRFLAHLGGPALVGVGGLYCFLGTWPVYFYFFY
jgi:hypothetical protein